MTLVNLTFKLKNEQIFRTAVFQYHEELDHNVLKPPEIFKDDKNYKNCINCWEADDIKKSTFVAKNYYKEEFYRPPVSQSFFTWDHFGICTINCDNN